MFGLILAFFVAGSSRWTAPVVHRGIIRKYCVCGRIDDITLHKDSRFTRFYDGSPLCCVSGFNFDWNSEELVFVKQLRSTIEPIVSILKNNMSYFMLCEPCCFDRVDILYMGILSLRIILSDQTGRVMIIDANRLWPAMYKISGVICCFAMLLVIVLMALD